MWYYIVLQTLTLIPWLACGWRKPKKPQLGRGRDPKPGAWGHLGDRLGTKKPASFQLCFGEVMLIIVYVRLWLMLLGAIYKLMTEFKERIQVKDLAARKISEVGQLASGERQGPLSRFLASKQCRNAQQSMPRIPRTIPETRLRHNTKGRYQTVERTRLAPQITQFTTLCTSKY